MLEASDAFKEAENLLKEAKNGRKLVCHENSVVRNYLYVNGFIHNAIRPCLIYNMTVKEFKNPKEEDGQQVVFVADHKSVAEHGSGRFVLPQKIYNEYKVYLDTIRPKDENVKISDDSPLFLTFTKKPITCDDILKGLKSFFKSAHLNIEVTSSSFRRMVTTKVHGQGSVAQIDSAARHLLHKKSTAESFYKNATRARDSANASKLIYNVIRNDSLPVEEEEDCSASTSNTPTRRAANDNTCPRGNAFFNAKQRSQVYIIFNEFIKCRVAPSSKDVRGKMKISKELKELHATTQFKIAQIIGCIRGTINRKSRK